MVRQHPDCGDEVSIEVGGVEEPLPVPGDADLLHRAVFNLILNAVQFAGADGSVAVTLRRESGPVVAEAARLPSPVSLTIRDSGPGVDPEVASRVFDPFFTTRTGGSGLGLAVVHRAVEAHSGAVVIGDAGGGGGEFTIYLPGRRPASTQRKEGGP
jgi:signal transduction histidine kinase